MMCDYTLLRKSAINAAAKVCDRYGSAQTLSLRISFIFNDCTPRFPGIASEEQNGATALIYTRQLPMRTDFTDGCPLIFFSSSSAHYRGP